MHLLKYKFFVYIKFDIYEFINQIMQDIYLIENNALNNLKILD